MGNFHSVRADLVEAARELRELVDAQGGYTWVQMDVSKAKRLRDLLHRADKAFESADAEADRQSRRIGTLESSNGALMVDRDRANSRAAEQVAAARELLVKHLGLDSPELDMRMREQAEYDRRTLALLDRENRAYDEFRTTIVSLMFELREVDVLDGERLAKVRSIVDRANKRALGR